MVGLEGGTFSLTRVWAFMKSVGGFVGGLVGMLVMVVSPRKERDSGFFETFLVLKNLVLVWAVVVRQLVPNRIR